MFFVGHLSEPVLLVVNEVSFVLDAVLPFIDTFTSPGLADKKKLTRRVRRSGGKYSVLIATSVGIPVRIFG